MPLTLCDSWNFHSSAVYTMLRYIMIISQNNILNYENFDISNGNTSEEKVALLQLFGTKYNCFCTKCQ